MITLHCKTGEAVKIDAEDESTLEGFTLCAHHAGMGARGQGRNKSRKTPRIDVYVYKTLENHEKIWMPLTRFLLGPTDDVDVDHINGDTFDCQKINLRFVEASTNNQNRPKLRPSGRRTTSKFIGVHKRVHLERAVWLACISKKGKSQSKEFPFTRKGEREAALWYDAKAKELYGPHARTNFGDGARAN